MPIKTREPTESYITLNGYEFCYFDWPGDGQCPILLLHATGFHARCWDQTIAHLPASNRIIALEMRGHGRSSNEGTFVLSDLAEDAVAFIDALDLNNIVLAGHSMGGYCSILIAANRPSRIKAVVLVDPIVLSREVYTHSTSEAERFGVVRAEELPVARRRNNWQSPTEMFDNFKDRHPFRLWQQKSLQDYCEHGLRRADDHYELLCPPVIEAQMYLGATQAQIYDVLPLVTQPVVVMRASPRPTNSKAMDFSKSPTAPDLAASFPNGTDLFFPDLSHFIPMQRPDLVADQIRSYLLG